MVLYGLRLSVMVDKIGGESPRFLHSRYADEFSTAGAGAHTKADTDLIEALGTTRGLFI